MNKRLEDPFETLQLPQHIEEELTEGVARVVAFHPSGNLLAAGCEDGSVSVYDFDTRGVCRKYKPHQKAVTCIAWMPQGLRLVTGSLDKAVVCQNVHAGPTVQESRIFTGTAVTRLDVNQLEVQQCLVSFAQGPPALLSFRDDSKRILPCIPPELEGRKDKGSAAVEAEAAFHRSGEVIFIAQGRGLVSVLHAATFRFLDVVKVPGSPRIKSLNRDQEGKRLLVNCADKFVRMYSVAAAPASPQGVPLGELPNRLSAAAIKAATGGSLLSPEGGPPLELMHQFGSFKDSVPAWRCAQFTGDSEYVSAPVATDKEHVIHVWSAWSKQLAAVMQGPDTGVLDLCWHPSACVAAVVTAQGSVYIWARHHRERWDAFAPGFDELDNNVEYVEREDEFDILPEHQGPGQAASESEADEDVDVFTLDQDDKVHVAPFLDVTIAPDPSPQRDGDESSPELSSSEEPPKQGGKQGVKRGSRSRSPSAQHTGSQRPRSSRRQSHAGSEEDN